MTTEAAVPAAPPPDVPAAAPGASDVPVVAPGPVDAAAPVPGLSEAPYPGLRPFRQDESDIFFGREEQTDALLGKLRRSRFLAVVGPSGCGKSSLVRAGMIAALEAGFLTDAGSRWRFAEMRPGGHPLARLARALLAPLALSPRHAQAGPEAAPWLEALLRRGPLGLVEALHETALPPGTNLLLLVDQFEEIFRFRREGSADEADAFVALLLATAQKPEVPVYVVLTMRSDYLGDCALFTGLPEAMNESQFRRPGCRAHRRRPPSRDPPACSTGGWIRRW